ncbi:hypothetical protein BSU01_22595 [Erwinia billingiae]|nr:hypothetical protein [Erwinia billingiae]
MLKRVFHLTLRAEKGVIESIFTLMKLPLRCPGYSCVRRRARYVNIPFKKTHARRDSQSGYRLHRIKSLR